jgi:hypothetical protein
LEVNIAEPTDIDKVIEYMDKLRGKLPITSTKTPKPTKDKVNPYQEIFQAIKAKEYIEDIIEYLTEINFRFISQQFMEERSAGDPQVWPKDFNYQWMVRVLRYAKDPANDKFDFTLLVGIKFMGKQSDKIYIMFNGEKKAVLLRKWRKDNSAINMKKKKVAMKFPDFMTIEERKHWRHIRRKVELKRNIGTKDQKFYDRYITDIKNINDANGNYCL